MSLLYCIAGVAHFLRPRTYLKIMPRYVPWHRFWVLFTGAWELIGGLLLMPLVTRTYAAWSIILLLIIVFPANVEMMLKYKRKKHPLYWAMVVRLPLQILLIWWVWQYT